MSLHASNRVRWFVLGHDEAVIHGLGLSVALDVTSISNSMAKCKIKNVDWIGLLVCILLWV